MMAREWRMHDFQDKLGDQMPEANKWSTNGIQEYLKLPRPICKPSFPFNGTWCISSRARASDSNRTRFAAFWDDQLVEICRRPKTRISCWTDRCCSNIEAVVQKMYKEEQSIWENKDSQDTLWIVRIDHRHWPDLHSDCMKLKELQSLLQVSFLITLWTLQTDHWWGLSTYSAKCIAYRHDVIWASMQDVEAFDQPKVELEQYPTSVELAARMLYTVSFSLPKTSKTFDQTGPNAMSLVLRPSVDSISPPRKSRWPFKQDDHIVLISCSEIACRAV